MDSDEIYDTVREKHLNLSKINKLSDVKAKAVMDLYLKLLDMMSDPSQDDYSNLPILAIGNLLMTLEKSGFLETTRNQNLNEILED
jgi:hypothetical protein